MKQQLADLPDVSVLHLIYQQMTHEGQAKDYEFSGTSMREHWDAGYRDTRRTLRHTDWLQVSTDGGIAVHDVHRIDD
jgi:NTE family protein